MSEFGNSRGAAAPDGPSFTACLACDVRERSICSALHESELDRLAAIMTRVPMAHGQTIVQEGDDAEHVYVVVEGAVRVFRQLADGRRQITGFLYASDFLGIALKDRYAYSAEAVIPTALCRFPRARFEQLMDESGALEKRLLEEAADELIAAQEQMLVLGRSSSAERLAWFLLGPAVGPHPDGSATTVQLVMRRPDIADYLGLTLETVSRGFTTLREAGLIGMPNSRTVVLLDVRRLREFARRD